MGKSKGRPAAAKYLRGLIDELKASAFVAAGLKRSGQHDAVVAPAATDRIPRSSRAIFCFSQLTT